jgi:hypothetical protein
MNPQISEYELLCPSSRDLDKLHAQCCERFQRAITNESGNEPQKYNVKFHNNLSILIDLNVRRERGKTPRPLILASIDKSKTWTKIGHSAASAASFVLGYKMAK